MGAPFIAQLLRAMSGILEEYMRPLHTSNPREAKSTGTAEHLVRRRQLRGLLTLALAAILFAILRAGIHRVFTTGWWRLW
jgi:hypothetical protein